MSISRRHCLKTLGAGAAAALAGSTTARALAQEARTESKVDPSKLAMPGLYRGRVAAVENRAVLASGAYQATEVQRMMRRGMTELTGADDWVEAWRQLFQPGDVVGIKVNPVGSRRVISDASVLHEIIAGLEAIGVKRHDIVVYDRYRAQFLHAGFDKWLPEGVRTASATEDYDNVQHAIEGYDPEHYLDLPLTLPGHDTSSLTARRSYAARFITREVNKLVNLPVLKEHQSAGITLALKNLSHGLVNNVSRSHSSKTLNFCGAFIPAVVGLPVIRNKTVLHVLDGVKGVYNGGPSARPQFIWEHHTLYFATDPVALDRIGWDAIDKRRVEAGMKPVIEDGPDRFSTFVRRQPEHVEIAGAMGLGEADRAKIDLRAVQL